ncbi:MAG: hypothetical protein KJ645_05235 [Planctomycetes bacterium]|nr:hypothetical protein [Planctomycetota bacterium]
MKLEVTRDVARDLWFLKRLGEASADSQALLDDYLSGDEAFASTLKESERLTHAMPDLHLPFDEERRIMDDARKYAQKKLLIIGVAVGITGIAMLTALGSLLFLMFRNG